MPKKVILHIGCEKTGTTSIQHTMFLNRDVLLNSMGVLYPQSLGGTNHWKLAVFTCNQDIRLTKHLQKDEDINLFREKLRKEFLKEVNETDPAVVVISNEWLHPRVQEPEEFNRLKDLLSEVTDDVQIVLYLRKQDKLATSLYSTSLKAGNCRKFKFPKIAVDNTKITTYYYDFLSLYRNWKKAFGAGKVTVRVFDRGRLFDGDVVRDFFDLNSFDTRRVRFISEKNQSLSVAGVIVLRYFNYGLYWGRRFIKPDHARAMRHSLAVFFSGKQNPTSLNDGSIFYNNFIKSNRELEEEYYNDSSEKIRLF